MATLGEDLKRLREARAVSLEEIAGQTKISVRLLKALEDDRHDLLPEPFFLKGVLRAYVKAAGGDEAAFLRRYAEEKATREPASPESEAKRGKSRRRDSGRTGEKDIPLREAAPGPPPAERRRRGGRGRRIALFGVILIAVAAAAVLFFYYLQTRPRPLPLVASPKIDPVPLPPVPPLSLTAAEIQATAPETGPLVLEFRFQADTWMHVAADGRVVLEGIQPPGRTIRYQANDIFIVQTGNAGGFSYTLNGRPGRPLGSPGAVRIDVRITRETAADFWEKGGTPNRAG